MKRIFLLLILSLFSYLAKAQIEPYPYPYPYPCGGDIALVGTPTTASSIKLGESSSVLVDNNKEQSNTSFSTNEEINPYVDIDLQERRTVAGAKLFGSKNLLMDHYYVFFSNKPFIGKTLEDIVFSPFVKYIQVSPSVPNGAFIDLSEPTKARYVRVQLASKGVLTLVEIDVIGLEEICGNGTDDDCDGLIDCADPDCSGFINQSAKDHVNPTCPICNDGKIDIYGLAYNSITTPWGYTYYNETLYSIDGGATYQSTRFFSNLDEGEYYLQIKNPVTGCIVTHPDNPVILKAPSGIPQSFCENGDFELGGFSNWSATSGDINNGGNTPIQPLAQSKRFKILSGLDLFTNSSKTFQGTYAAQLGYAPASAAGIGQVSKLSYNLDISNNNNPLRFAYSAVIQDGENATFSYIVYVDIGNGFIPIESKFISAATQGLSSIITPEGIKVFYSGWKCVQIDLSGYIGKKAKVEFTTSESSTGNRFAYAYIDGMCLSAENSSPIPIIDINDVYCKNQKPVIVGNRSSRFSAYKWEISRQSQNGTVEISQTTPVITSDKIADLDVISILGNNQYLCGRTYQVKLTLYSDCSSPVVLSKTFTSKCSESQVKYKDIVICNNNFANNVQIETASNFNCTNCTYSWTPTAGLLSPSSIQPTIQGTDSYAGNAFDNKYTVKATNQDGCIYEDIVATIKANLSYKYFDNQNEHCKYNIQGILEFNEPVESNYFTTEFTTCPTGSVNQPNLVSNTNNSTYIYNHPLSLDKGSPVCSQFKFTPSFPSSLYKVIGGNCNKSINIPIPDFLLYYGDFNIVIPNAFTPNGDGVNDVFRPIVLPSLGPEYIKHNAIRGSLQIFSRWNSGAIKSKIYDSGWVSGTPTEAFDINLLSWDGTNQNGGGPTVDVYVFKLKLFNCTEGEIVITGDVTLIL